MSKIIVSSLTLDSSITSKRACFYECCACAQALSCGRFFVIPWTVARQAPMSLECSRQEYWSGLPFSTPRDLPHSGIKPASFSSSVFAGTFFTTVPPGKPLWVSELQKMAVLFGLPWWLRWESSILLSLYPFQWLKSQKTTTTTKNPSGSPCSTKLFSCQDMLSYVLILIILNYKVHFFHLKLESFPLAFL